MDTETLKTLLGIAWASPVTLVSLLLHVVPMWLLGGYEYVGRRESALVWAVKTVVPRHMEWLKERWKGWNGHCGGNVIVVREHPDRWNSAVTLKHEQAHVRQVMTLGVFHPVIYGLCYVAIKLACPMLDPYHDTIFELAARREAGQKELRVASRR